MNKTILVGILIYLLFYNQCTSQPYGLVLQNHTMVNQFEFQFDIYIGNNFEYAKGKYVIKFPANTSSDLTFTFVPDCSELLYYQIPQTLEYDTLNKLLIIYPRNVPGPGNGTFSPVYGDRVARISILSSDTLNYYSCVGMMWQNSGNEYTRIYAYVNSTLTEITDSSGHTKDFDPVLGFSAPYTPVLMRPNNNSIVSSFPLRLVCFYPTHTFLYRVQIATDSIFINRVIDDYIYPINHFPYDSLPIKILNPLTKYYWRVNVHNFYAISPFSQVWSFSTDDLTNLSDFELEIPEKFSLSQNYPNPFNPVTHLEFGISDLGFVSLEVFDISGAEIVTLVNEKLSLGSYKFEFDGSNYASGVYFYKLTTNNFSETKRMILLK